MAKTKYFRLALNGSFIFYIISGVSSVLNYLVYPLISNIVDIKTFGEIQFLFTAFNQLSLGFVVLNILSILATAKSKDKKEEKKRILSLNMIASLVAGVISIVGVAVLIVFKSQLQLHNTTAIILLGVGLLVNVPFTITIGQLQGNSRFLQSGVISLMATFLKLVLSIVFVKIGLGATGAMLGVVIGMLISTLVGLWLNSGLKVKAKDADISSISFLKKPAIYSLILIGTLTIASSLDLLVARTILTQTDAGIYSGVATISKIILAVLSPIIWLSIPLAVKGDKKTTYKYLLISILLAVCFVIVIFLSINVIMSYIMNIPAAQYNSLAMPLAIGMSFYALGLITAGVLIGASVQAKTVSLIYIISTTVLLLILLITPGITMLTVIIFQALNGFILATITFAKLYLSWKE